MLDIFSYSQTAIVVNAIVLHVVDGDTILVRSFKVDFHVRFLDCWCPELNTNEGIEAKQYLENLLPVGSSCRVHIPITTPINLLKMCTFGRILGSVQINDDIDLSKQMVDAGYATKTRPLKSYISSERILRVVQDLSDIDYLSGSSNVHNIEKCIETLLDVLEDFRKFQ